MSDQKPLAKKLPASIQAVLGLALTGLGAYVMVMATPISKAAMLDPALVFQFVLFLIGVLYLLNGIPSMIEGIMTLNAEMEQNKLLQVPAKEKK